MSKRSQAEDWTSKFQEAALDPTQWLPVLQDLAESTGSGRAELVGFGGAGFVPFNWITYSDQQMLEDFNRAGGALPTLNYRLAADDGSSTLKIVDESEYDRTRQQMGRSDYLDFCEQYGIVFGCQTVLHREDNGLIGLSLLRTRADGRTDERARQTFAKAAGAARVAVRMQRAIEQQGGQLLTGALGAMSLPCLLLDGFGQVQSLTSAAEDLLQAEPLLSLSDKRLTSPDPRVHREIELALRTVLSAEPRPHVSLRLGEQHKPHLVLDVFRLPHREWTMHFAPRAIVVLRDPRSNMRHNAAILAATFGLTPAETEVALALCDGVPRKQIAANRRVSIETLRTQIRNLYSKTGCGRESELLLMFKALLG